VEDGSPVIVQAIYT